jgi:4-hydroxyphenylpyruvate dioxygenase
MGFVGWENTLGTDGFEFIEFTSANPAELGQLFENMGFVAVAQHRHKAVTLYRQGEINFILNAEKNSLAQRFSHLHGPSICAMAFRVADAKKAYDYALDCGAWGVEAKSGPMELNIPAIKGIGDSLIYLVDRWEGKDGLEKGDIGNISIYDVDFVAIPGALEKLKNQSVGLELIDHLTHNVYQGQMQQWADFYSKIFNFREIRYFDIEGKLTGLKSKAMTSPCGKIRIPINESSDDKSQIMEYLHEYHGEGIQHVALSTSHIYNTVRALRETKISLQDTPDTYYDQIPTRIPEHGENLDELRELRILLDGAPDDTGLLLQIFTKNLIGPIFFEIIQRKGNEGFGEGNFKALFESIELDQIRRGVLKDSAA